MSEANECPRLAEVHRLWEGEIDPLRAGEVRRHLARCSACRAEYEEWDRLSRLLTRGDPALPLVPERWRLLKEQLIQDCAANVGDVAGAVRGQSAPSDLETGGRGHGGRPGTPLPCGLGRLSPLPRLRIARVAGVLAPLAAAALLLFYAGRPEPTDESRTTRTDSRSTAVQTRQDERETARPGPEQAVPQPSKFVRTAGPPKQPAVRPPKFSQRDWERPQRFVRTRRVARAIRSAAIRRDRRSAPASRSPVARTPAEDRSTAAPGSEAAAPRPIERLIIQVDERPEAPAAEAGTVTHVTIIATGDPEAGGAELTVVRSQKQEAIP